MSDMEIFKCPVHSLTQYRNRIEENDLTYPDQMQLLVYDAVRQQPSDDYYFEAVRPQVNALLSHFMERFFLPNFKAMRANTRDNSLDNQYLALVDDYHGYQLELYNDYFISLYTSEMQLKGPEVSNLDRNLWHILGQLTGPLVKGRHQTEAYAALRELFNKLQVDDIFLSTPQTKLVYSGVGTAMKFTNILRNISEKYSWQQIHNGSTTSEEAYSEVFETARSAHKLLPELMSLPIHGGARVLDEVLDGFNRLNPRVNEKFFNIDFANRQITFTPAYAQIKAEYIDPETFTTLCPLWYTKNLDAEGQRGTTLYFEEALYGASKYLFAPQAGIQIPSYSQMFN